MSVQRILVFIVAYNAERTIRDVLRRIPASLKAYDLRVLVIDDSSLDATFDQAHHLASGSESVLPTTVLYNPVNQGYGGNQKIGFHYAVTEGFDMVALLHGDGQYAPEKLPDLVTPIVRGEADAVFGSRMMEHGGARRGGMPLYKFVGNRILTALQNRFLKMSLSEFHSGYRVYSTAALKCIPFDLNSNDFHFDTEIIIQLARANLRIKELPIPTYYGDEICHVNGIKYAWNVLVATVLSRIQDLGLLYERKFDLAGQGHAQYVPKLDFESPHTLALQRIPPQSRVLDIGCASGHVSAALALKGCKTVGIDLYEPDPNSAPNQFIKLDLNRDALPVDVGQFDHVTMLDVIEHLQDPEAFLERLRAARKGLGQARLLISTGNVAFIIVRLMLMLGSFNYGKRGILDKTHTRLFTFGSLTRLLQQAGYDVEEVRGVPAPFALAVGRNGFSRILLGVNRLLIRISRSLFSYQIFIVARPRPTLNWLLEQAFESREERVRRSMEGTTV